MNSNYLRNSKEEIYKVIMTKQGRFQMTNCSQS